MAAVDPALLEALVRALADDPFYDAVLPANDREAALAGYFDASIDEGLAAGRVRVTPDARSGAAVWLLPAPPGGPAIRAAKEQRLRALLGAQGYATYERILASMTPLARRAACGSAWYLSILGVDPAAQGQGVGGRLIEPTLAEADAAGATAYLETFNPRSVRFYQRHGFAVVASHREPVTGASYDILVRQPHAIRSGSCR
jgi:GNAT superfamily N-acetyltransferase